jgi:ubiquitin-conjugating enzyme E2 variant
MTTLVSAIFIILLADFVSGVVHWAEDTFWTENTPLLGKWVVSPNMMHHKDAGAFVRHSWLQSSWDLLMGGLAVVGVAWLMGRLSWQIWLFVAISVNANQIHKWSHTRDADIPAPIRLLQRWRVLQSRVQHGSHHRGQKNSSYCVVTPYVNPVLDRLRFWRGLERILVPIFGAPRRDDLLWQFKA